MQFELQPRAWAGVPVCCAENESRRVANHAGVRCRLVNSVAKKNPQTWGARQNATSRDGAAERLPAIPMRIDAAQDGVEMVVTSQRHARVSASRSCTTNEPRRVCKSRPPRTPGSCWGHSRAPRPSIEASCSGPRHALVAVRSIAEAIDWPRAADRVDRVAGRGLEHLREQGVA